MAKKRDNSSGDDQDSKKAWSLLHIESHDEIEKNLAEIFQRIDSQPELGRLLVINPIFVLEDVGVTLSEELRDHIERTLGFPKGRVEKIREARKRAKKLFEEADLKLPKTPKERAELVFNELRLTPKEGEASRGLSVEQMRAYRADSPLAEAVYDLGRLERGAIIFHSRGSYDEHKKGKVHHPWLTSIRLRRS